MALSVLAAVAIYSVAVPLPGPGLVAVTRATITSGRTAGTVTAIGVTLAVTIYSVAALLGVGALLMALPWLVTAIQLGGGAYLLFLGLSLLWSHFRTRVAPPESPSLGISAPDRATLGRSFLRGFAVTIGNPKLMAFFFGLFAPLAGASTQVGERLAVLSGVLLVDLIYHQTLVQLINLAGRSSPARRLRRSLDAIAGTLMAAFGIGLMSKAIAVRS